MNNKELTRERLFELLEYKPDTGEFFWKHTNRTKVKGRRAGSERTKGGKTFIRIKLDGTERQAHRLVILAETGVYPGPNVEIWHINGEGTDNRFENLVSLDTHLEETPRIDQLLALYTYDPNKGKLFHRFSRTNSVKGEEIGYVDSQGYRCASIMGRKFLVHRIIWLIENGAMPPEGLEVDHINGVRDDNRITNLRLVTSQGNTHNARKARPNSRTGVLGVRHSGTGRFTAGIGLNWRYHHLGTFDTVEQAHEAYVQAKRVLHPTCTI